MLNDPFHEPGSRSVRSFGRNKALSMNLRYPQGIGIVALPPFVKGE